MDDAATVHGVEGRVVIVTGSGRGIGLGIARHLGRGGASVVVAEIDADRRNHTVAELTDLGVDVLGVACDVGDKTSVDAMVATTVERFGRVDALVNNAQSFRPTAPIAEVDADDMEVFHRTGPLGTLWAMQAVRPHMAANGWGRIVNFASLMGVTGGAGFAAYNASKEAVRALTRTAAREWASDGIVVNAVAPAAAAHETAATRRFVEQTPMGRQGDPEGDVAPVVWFLCSDACRFLTGHTFMVDGGAHMPT